MENPHNNVNNNPPANPTPSIFELLVFLMVTVAMLVVILKLN